MDSQGRARIAIALAGILLFGSLVSLVAWRVDLGMRFGVQDGILRIVDVAPYGPAASEGFRPGMAVVSINGEPLLQLPQYIFATPDPNGEGATPVGVTPDRPTPIAQDPLAMLRLTEGSIHELQAIQASDLQTHEPDAIPMW